MSTDAPTTTDAPDARPGWLDETMYPFAGRKVPVDGSAMHVLDEGAGPPIVFVHGTPTWSFLWRHLVHALCDDHRCVAPDHLGFGLSDKPANADYTPAAHARRLEEAISRLDLRDIVLVVHDFGGPIGLSYALDHPDNVRGLVIMNTWMWSNEGNRAAEFASRLFGSPLGRFLYRRLDLSARFLLKSAYADKAKLTPAIHRHYRAPFDGPAQRQAPWVLARELAGSNDWYDGLWQRRGALAEIPALVLWGMRDPLVRASELATWREALPHARIERIEQAGHFLQEEAPEEVASHLRAFMGAERERAPRVPQ